MTSDVREASRHVCIVQVVQYPPSYSGALNRGRGEGERELVYENGEDGEVWKEKGMNTKKPR